jgi:hypothetical protein
MGDIAAPFQAKRWSGAFHATQLLHGPALFPSLNELLVVTV